MSACTFVAAHAAGVCDAIYTPDGSHIITCGSDKLICVRNKDEPGKVVVEMKENEDAVTCLAMNKSGTQLVSGSEDNMVKSFRLPDGTFEDNVARLTLPIKSLAFSPNGVFLAVASEESHIRLVNTLDTKQMIQLKGHAGPVRSLHFDPNCTFLASSSDDGSVRVWRIQNKMCVKTWNDLPVVGAPYQFSQIAWSPCGSYLAMPGDNGRVEVKSRDAWETVFTLKGHREVVDIISWSPNGSYLLTACLGHIIMLWDTTSHESIGKFVCEQQVSQIRWSPNENAFTAIDVNGKITVQTEVVPSHMPMPFAAEGSIVVGAASAKPPTAANTVGNAPTSAPAKSSDKSPAKATTKFVIDDDDDSSSDDDDHPPRAIASKPQLKRLARAKDIASKNKKSNEFSISALKSSYGFESDDDELQEQEEALELEEYLREQRANAERGYGSQHGGGETRIVTKVVSSGVKPQPSFQPGSTPKLEDRPRFLAWNNIGTIVSREEETHSSVEIEFADKASHRAVRLMDRFGFTMASLAENGAVFASPEKVDKSESKKKNSIPSTIFFRPFSTWAQNSEWLVHLPAGEEATAVAVGDTFVAVATSQQYLRLFGTSGLQYAPIMLPGPVVAMTAKEGSELAVVYHKTNPVRKTQNLFSMLFQVDKKKTIVDTALPLRPSKTLSWIGYSEIGVLHALDSSGLVLSLQRSFGFQWSPVLDTETHPSLRSRGATHWPISISRGRLICVVMKAENLGRSFPLTSPKPVPTAVPLTVPLAMLDTDVGKVEALIVQDEMEFTNMLRDSDNSVTPQIRKKLAAIDTHIIKIFNAAVQKGRLVRALDLSMRLKLLRSCRLAVQLARRLNQESLAVRINMAMRVKFGDAAIEKPKELVVDEESESSSDEEELDLSTIEPVQEKKGKSKKVRRANARDYSRKNKPIARKQPRIFGASKPTDSASPKKPASAKNKTEPSTTDLSQTTETPAKELKNSETTKDTEKQQDSKKKDVTSAQTSLTPATKTLSLKSQPTRRVNPFSQNNVTAATKSQTTPTKRSGSVFDAIDDLEKKSTRPSTLVVPSPLKKRPALTRTSSFSAEARQKQGTIFSKPAAGLSEEDKEKAAQQRERRSKKAHDVRA